MIKLILYTSTFINYNFRKNVRNFVLIIEISFELLDGISF